MTFHIFVLLNQKKMIKICEKTSYNVGQSVVAPFGGAEINMSIAYVYTSTMLFSCTVNIGANRGGSRC